MFEIFDDFENTNSNFLNLLRALFEKFSHVDVYKQMKKRITNLRHSVEMSQFEKQVLKSIQLRQDPKEIFLNKY